MRGKEEKKEGRREGKQRREETNARIAAPRSQYKKLTDMPP